MGPEDFKRKLTAILSADVAGYMALFGAPVALYGTAFWVQTSSFTGSGLNTHETHEETRKPGYRVIW